MIVEVHNSSERLAIVEMTLDLRASGQAADAHLNPGIGSNDLRFGKPEVFHQSEAFRVGPEIGMPEAGTGVLIGVGKREFVSEGILLQKAKSVADSDVVVRFGQQPWSHKIRPQHDKQVGAGARLLSTAAGPRRLVLGPTNQREGAKTEHQDRSDQVRTEMRDGFHSAFPRSRDTPQRKRLGDFACGSES